MQVCINYSTIFLPFAITKNTMPVIKPIIINPIIQRAFSPSDTVLFLSTYTIPSIRYARLQQPKITAEIITAGLNKEQKTKNGLGLLPCSLYKVVARLKIASI